MCICYGHGDRSTEVPADTKATAAAYKKTHSTYYRGEINHKENPFRRPFLEGYKL